MYQVDPQQLIAMIRQGYNPQQLMMSVLQSRMGNTPIGQNLLSLAQKGDSASIEKIARNIVAQQGRDFDTEFKAFKESLGFK